MEIKINYNTQTSPKQYVGVTHHYTWVKSDKVEQIFLTILIGAFTDKASNLSIIQAENSRACMNLCQNLLYKSPGTNWV